MNALDKIHQQATGEGPEQKKDTHLCIACGNLVSRCVCDPAGGQQHDTELRFRQEVRAKLKEMDEKLDLLIAAWVET